MNYLKQSPASSKYDQHCRFKMGGKTQISTQRLFILLNIKDVYIVFTNIRTTKLATQLSPTTRDLINIKFGQQLQIVWDGGLWSISFSIHENLNNCLLKHSHLKVSTTLLKIVS